MKHEGGEEREFGKRRTKAGRETFVLRHHLDGPRQKQVVQQMKIFVTSLQNPEVTTTHLSYTPGCTCMLVARSGHHQAGEVGHGADGDLHAHHPDVPCEDPERLHPGPVVLSLGRPLPFRRRPVSRMHHQLRPGHLPKAGLAILC